MSIAELTDKALALPPDEKEELIQILVDSMPGDGDLTQEDIELALQRDREIEEGLVEPITYEEFIKAFPERNGLIRS